MIIINIMLNLSKYINKFADLLTKNRVISLLFVLSVYYFFITISVITLHFIPGKDTNYWSAIKILNLLVVCILLYGNEYMNIKNIYGNVMLWFFRFILVLLLVMISFNTEIKSSSGKILYIF